MRLLNTETFEVKEVLTDIPTFAILSHTWAPGNDEVTFQDIQNLENAKKKAGWSKVKKACEYVRKYRFEWIWIDTCCIDKSSSAELSEVLNSMYQYYEDSQVCIAYLSDVSKERNVKDLENLKKSRWFTRGWTLQELIAPCYLVFLDQNWNMVGTRHSMREVISEVTSIPVGVFKKGQIDDYSVAQKMSWAASRETTRPEDMAYCLMGLFGVNMPPIYGEGAAKAFMRLQQEIIKYSDDRSIFAWVASPDYYQDRGLFAISPSEFVSSGDVGVSKSQVLGDRSAFSFGNNGLRIHLPLQHLTGLGEGIFLASLHCRTATDKYTGIYLQQKGHRYIRWQPDFPLPCIDDSSSELQEIVVKESKIPRLRDKSGNHKTPFEFKLDNSQITLLGEVDGFFDTNPRSVPLPFCPYPDRYFRLLNKNANEFNVGFWTVADVITPALFIDNCLIPFDPSDLQDSVLSCLEDSNALVSCFVHMTGDASRTRILQIDYIPSSSAEFEFHQQIDKFRSSPHASSSTSLNFMVNDKSRFFNIYEVLSASSSNLLCSPSSEGQKTYGTLSYHCEQHEIHCVLAYEPRSIDEKFVFIALGVRAEWEGDMPWIDVFVSSEEVPISDIWESYLPSGSRYGCRNKQNITASLDSDYSLNLTVEKKILGLAWYHVVMETGYHLETE